MNNGQNYISIPCVLLWQSDMETLEKNNLANALWVQCEGNSFSFSLKGRSMLPLTEYIRTW